MACPVFFAIGPGPPGRCYAVLAGGQFVGDDIHLTTAVTQGPRWKQKEHSESPI